MIKLSKFTAAPLAALALLGGGAIAGYTTLAAAQGTTTGTTTAGFTMPMHAPGVHGTISAMSGNTLTVTDDRSNTSYTVDATGATIKKFTAGSAPATITVADLAVGQKVGVRGTVLGTSVTATEIVQGDFMGHRGGMMGGIHGRGPGVMGTVSAINGSQITVTGKNGKTYTVDAGSAKVHHLTEGTLSDVTVGETIGVRGSVSGTTVTAQDIMTGIPAAPVQ